MKQRKGAKQNDWERRAQEKDEEEGFSGVLPSAAQREES